MTDSLKKRYVIKLIANIVAGVINALLVAIVPKALGPVAYGQFTFLQQLFNQILAFLDAGTSIAFYTKISADNSRKELIKFYAFFTLILFLFVFVLVFFNEKAGYAEFIMAGIPAKYIYLGLCFCLLTWLAQVYVKVSDAYALTVSVEIVKIFHKVLMLGVLVYIINYWSFDLSIYYYFNVVSLVFLVFVLSLLFVKKEVVGFFVFSMDISYKKIGLEFYQFCFPLLVFNVLATAVGIFDIWLLQYVSGSVETGFYGLAYSISAMCFLFTSAMTPVITREFSKCYSESNLHEIKKLFMRYVPMLYAIAAYFSVFVAFEAQNLLSIFTDERFEGAYFALVVIAFYPLHQTYGQINSALFFATEDTVKYRNIGLLSTCIGLAFSYVFIYEFEWGAIGFAWKMIIAQLLAVNIQLFINVKKLKLNYFFFLSHQVFTILFFSVLAYFSNEIVNIEGERAIDFMVTGVVYSVFVLVGAFILPFVFGFNRQELYGILSRSKKNTRSL